MYPTDTKPQFATRQGIYGKLQILVLSIFFRKRLKSPKNHFRRLKSYRKFLIFKPHQEVYNMKNFTRLLIIIVATGYGCMRKDLYQEKDSSVSLPPDTDETNLAQFLYPFESEIQGAEAEISIELKEPLSGGVTSIVTSIPPLKYNKSLLFMLTQDDCKHSAFCRTWAAINGKPITPHNPVGKSYYYDYEHLEMGDLPPAVYSLGKTLGSTDGHGNEVRFHFTTTISPQWPFMNAGTNVNTGFQENFYRFFMKAGLRWANVKEMVNFGTGVALHDLMSGNLAQVDSISKHLQLAQEISSKELRGRRVKLLVEPHGDKRYIEAGFNDLDIQTMAVQSGASPFIPAMANNSMVKVPMLRQFLLSGDDIKILVKKQSSVPLDRREAVYVAVHETDNSYIESMLWLNDTFGKDGSDSLWFPSQEELFEYNYNRKHCVVIPSIENNTLRLKVKFPATQNFYYPSITLNIKGIEFSQVKSVSSNNVVTGLSFGPHQKGISVNIDCRKYLFQQASFYVSKYLISRKNADLIDARYFLSMLKDSEEKTKLQSQLQK